MMKIIFKDKSPDEILVLLQQKVATIDNLANMVAFELQNQDLRVLIKKMGTSTLEFSHSAKGKQVCWELTKESLAFAHKPLRNEFIKQIQRMVEKLGGECQLHQG
jgi:hypothetical protein